MAKQTESINLLQAKEKNLLENFLHWALTVGRFVVILTETVAICAFLYRFSLDAQIIDLHEDIKNQETIVTVYKDKEETYRDVQRRLAVAQQLITGTDKYVVVASEVSQIGKDIIQLKSISVNAKTVAIDANVQSISALGTYIRALKSYKYIKVVSLDKIENKTTQAVINVNITADLK